MANEGKTHWSTPATVSSGDTIANTAAETAFASVVTIRANSMASAVFSF